MRELYMVAEIAWMPTGETDGGGFEALQEWATFDQIEEARAFVREVLEKPENRGKRLAIVPYLTH